MCVPQRRNYAKFQISETPSVDSTAQYNLHAYERHVGFLEGAHPIAAELTTCGLPGVEPQIVAVFVQER